MKTAKHLTYFECLSEEIKGIRKQQTPAKLTRENNTDVFPRALEKSHHHHPVFQKYVYIMESPQQLCSADSTIFTYSFGGLGEGKKSVIDYCMNQL